MRVDHGQCQFRNCSRCDRTLERQAARLVAVGRGRHSLAEGQIKFKVQVAGHAAFLNLRAALRSVTPDGAEVCKHAVGFLKMAVNVRRVLSAFVHQTLEEAD